MRRRTGPVVTPDTDVTDPRPVRRWETFITYTDPMTLAPVHPLRRSSCLLCGMLIGGRACRFVQMVIAGEVACKCGNLVTVSQLVCGDHGKPDVVKVVAAAMKHMSVVHGDMSCRRPS